MIPLLRPPPQLWYCPHRNCESRAKTVDAKIPMHPCKGLKGLLAPLVREGERAKVETREREDYIGNEDVQFDADGRPVMSVVTTRDTGQDCTVFAPIAHVDTKEWG